MADTELSIHPDGGEEFEPQWGEYGTDCPHHLHGKAYVRLIGSGRVFAVLHRMTPAHLEKLGYAFLDAAAKQREANARRDNDAALKGISHATVATTPDAAL